jgi:hypothetical protein
MKFFHSVLILLPSFVDEDEVVVMDAAVDLEAIDAADDGISASGTALDGAVCFDGGGAKLPCDSL